MHETSVELSKLLHRWRRSRIVSTVDNKTDDDGRGQRRSSYPTLSARGMHKLNYVYNISLPPRIGPVVKGD